MPDSPCQVFSWQWALHICCAPQAGAAGSSGLPARLGPDSSAPEPSSVGRYLSRNGGAQWLQNEGSRGPEPAPQVYFLTDIFLRQEEPVFKLLFVRNRIWF